MIFDIQACDGEYVVHKSLKERQSLLRDVVCESDTVKIVKSRNVGTYGDLRQMYDDVLGNGGEGLIVKDLRIPYTPGERKHWIKLKPLHLHEHRSEYDLYVHRALLDKNGNRSILECGYYEKCKNAFVQVCRVSSGLNDTARNRIKLLINPDGLFKRRTVVTVSADKITNKKSLRHPVFLRFSFEKHAIDDTLFI